MDDVTALLQHQTSVSSGAQRENVALVNLVADKEWSEEEADSIDELEEEEDSIEHEGKLDPCSGVTGGTFVGAKCGDDDNGCQRTKPVKGLKVAADYTPDPLADMRMFYCPASGLDYVTGTKFTDLLPNQPVVSKFVSDGKAAKIQKQVGKKGFMKIQFHRSGMLLTDEGNPAARRGKWIVENHHGTVQALKLGVPILIANKNPKTPLKYEDWTNVHLLQGDKGQWKDTVDNFNQKMGLS